MSDLAFFHCHDSRDLEAHTSAMKKPISNLSRNRKSLNRRKYNSQVISVSWNLKEYYRLMN